MNNLASENYEKKNLIKIIKEYLENENNYRKKNLNKNKI